MVNKIEYQLPYWWPPAPGAVLGELDLGRGVVGENGSVYWSTGYVTYDFIELEEDVQKGTLSLLLP